MGGNGSYGKALGGVAEKDRTHYDTGYRIDGHKVVILKTKPDHDKFIMEANSRILSISLHLSTKILIKLPFLESEYTTSTS